MNLRKNIYQSVRPYWLLVVLLLTAPFVLYIVAQILPIGDDFSYFTASIPRVSMTASFLLGHGGALLMPCLDITWKCTVSFFLYSITSSSIAFISSIPLLFPFFFVACSEVGQLSTQLLFFSISVRLCWVLSSIPTA